MKCEFTRTLPIVMWDFTWLEQHHRGGSFEDFDRVIDELIERGYEAVRIDVFPHLIAAAGDGTVLETFHFDHSGDLGSYLWGRCFSVELNVRALLVEFIHKLQQKGVKIGLSTWIRSVREGRDTAIGDVFDFIRIWDETLTFLKENGCLDNIIYVDLLNEYPLWHGYRQFSDIYNSFEEESPAQDAFYWDFANTALSALRKKWPDLRFLFSQTENHFSCRDLNKDYHLFDALDVHMWFQHDHEFADRIPYLGEVHVMEPDVHFAETNRLIHSLYKENKDACDRWMEEHIAQAAQLGRKYHIPVGNTEGWGIIMWREHPYLDWDFIKQAGLVCAELAAKEGYAFICSSNFCQPQFTTLWADVAYHREVTDIIRRGIPRY